MHVADAATVLELERFGVAFDRTVVLRSIDLRVASHDAVVIVGAGGAGKSTLLRTLAGLNDARPTFQATGSARYNSAPLGTGARPSLVGQSARLLLSDALENVAIGLPDRSQLTRREQRDRVVEALEEFGVGSLEKVLDRRVVDLGLAEQRCLALVRACVSRTSLVMADEPTAGLDVGSARSVLRLLRRVREQRSLLWVTHDRGAAKSVGGHLALLVSGRIAECGTIDRFFRAPASPAGRVYVETGTCYALPDTEGSPPSPEATYCAARSHIGIASTRSPSTNASPPRGFVWIIPGLLGALPRPGLLDDVANDVAGLGALGINLLVCLEESLTVELDLLQRHGISSLHVPIDDMDAPSVDVAVRLCSRIDEASSRGETIAIHCRAGLGRTGTIVAAYLIWRGAEPVEALERVRSLKPRSVQSTAQVSFLDTFPSVARSAVARRRAAN